MKRLKLIMGNKKIRSVLYAVFIASILVACGDKVKDTEKIESDNAKESVEEPIKESTEEADTELEIDFEEIRKEAPDAFAWLDIPDTGISAPILQNATYESDYYASHDSTGAESSTGAIYTEFPNATDFCDFNEIIYGVDREVVLSYKNPDYFNKHRNIEIYIEGNHMTYEVVMSRSWEKQDLLEYYAFPIDMECYRFLTELYDTRTLSDNIADNYLETTYRDFIVTLVADEPADASKQYMVIAKLVNDREGTIGHQDTSEFNPDNYIPE